jgi:hypothetical protein
VATDRASCLTRRIATLYSTTRITGAPVNHLRSTQQQCKTADALYVRTRLRVVTEFLTVEDSSPIEIHRRLRSVYCVDAIDVSSDAWSVVIRAVKRALVTGPAAAE